MKKDKKEPKGFWESMKFVVMPDPNPYKTSGFLEEWARLTAELYTFKWRVERRTRNALLDRQQLAREQLLRNLVPGTTTYNKVETEILSIKIQKRFP